MQSFSCEKNTKSKLFNNNFISIFPPNSSRLLAACFHGSPQQNTMETYKNYKNEK